MTGSDIKHIRLTRGLTLRQMAALLKDASHTTISRWEDSPDEPLPSWVAERLLGDLPITMSVNTFATLLELARRTGKSPEELFSEAIAEYADNDRKTHATAMASQIASTLAAINPTPIIHREIKPAGITYDPTAEETKSSRLNEES